MLEYNGPRGETLVSPTHEQIKEILTYQADYWQGGGDSALTHGGDRDSLIFWKDDPYGIFIMRLNDYCAPYDSKKKIETVYHSVGGEPMAVPSCCYVDEEQAAEILLYYMDTGNVPDTYCWTDIYELIEPNEF